MNISLHYNCPDGIDFETLLYSYPNSEFHNLTRSTIPLLQYWKKYKNALNEISNKIEIKDSINNCKICFEFPVKSYPRAKPSFTDIMVISKNYVIGIEGKYTEPIENIAEWMKKRKDKEFGEQVLEHWQDIIHKKVKFINNDIDMNNIIYQLLHRTASVLSIEASKYFVIYQIFNDGKHDIEKYKTAMKQLCNILESNSLVKFGLFIIEMKKTDNYPELEKRIKTLKKEDMANVIRKAIIDDKIYNFISCEYEGVF